MIRIEFDEGALDQFPIQVQEALLRMSLDQERRRESAAGISKRKPLDVSIKMPDDRAEEEAELAKTLSGGGRILETDEDPLSMEER